MSTLTVKGNWNIAKGKLKQKYAQLTDDDLQFVEGKEDELIGRIQKATGQAREKISREVEECLWFRQDPQITHKIKFVTREPHHDERRIAAAAANISIQYVWSEPQILAIKRQPDNRASRQQCPETPLFYPTACGWTFTIRKDWQRKRSRRAIMKEPRLL